MKRGISSRLLLAVFLFIFAIPINSGASGPSSVDQDRGIAGHVAGDYDNASISVFALNLSWKY